MHVAVMVVPCVLVTQLQWVDCPDQGHQESAQEEHYSFLLDYTEIVKVEVVEFQGLHGNGHQGSREEHSKSVLEGKREIFMSLVVVLLEVSEVMEDIAHDELVEKDDSQKGDPGDDGSDGLGGSSLWRVRIFLFGFDGCDQVVGFDELQEVEDNSDDKQKEQAQAPPDNQVLNSIVRVLQVLVDDFSGLGGLLNDQTIVWVCVEVFPDFATVLIVLYLGQEILLLSLCFKDDDGIVCIYSVPVDLVNGLLNHCKLMALSTLQLPYVVLEVGFLVIFGLQVVLQRVLILFVSLLHFFDIRDQNNFMYFEWFIVFINFPSNEILELTPDSSSVGNVLDDDSVIGEVRLHFIIVGPGLVDLILDVEEGQDVNDKGADPQGVLVDIGHLLCARNHQEQVVALPRQVALPPPLGVEVGSPKEVMRTNLGLVR